MAKSKLKHVPMTPEAIEQLTTQQHMHRAYENADYWQKRIDRIQKLQNPTPGQLESLPWFTQHSLIWLGVAEKLELLVALEAAPKG